VKWELISLAPSPYLAVTGSADSEEEYPAIGDDLFGNLTGDLEAYDEDFDLSGATVLKIGTGPGRFLVQFGTRCGAVHGTDISLEKHRKARKLCRNRGVEPELHRSERGLPDIAAEFNLVYSMFVFQHMRKRSTLDVPARLVRPAGTLRPRLLQLRQPRRRGESRGIVRGELPRHPLVPDALLRA
jgi:2-polyprenyl-3-methyl-5-hydroxy-6-metoxy-1,4-benzoquinol methylase